MPWFLECVTDLKNTDIPNLRVKVYLHPSGDPENGKYMSDLQVDIDDHGHLEISGNKLYNLASDYLIAGYSEIELRVFAGADRLDCDLTPLKIRDNVRIIFRRDEGYEGNGRVVFDEIPRTNLPNCLVDRRGFGWLLGRKALYDAMENPVGSSDEVPSPTTMVSGMSNEETHQPKIAKWRRPISYLKTKSFLSRVRNRGSAAAAAPAV